MCLVYFYIMRKGKIEKEICVIRDRIIITIILTLPGSKLDHFLTLMLQFLNRLDKL